MTTTTSKPPAGPVSFRLEPKDLTKLSDKDLLAENGCFGTALFNAEDDACVLDCVVRNRCVGAFIKATMPTLSRESGLQFTRPDILAQATGMSPPTVEVIMRARRGENPDVIFKDHKRVDEIVDQLAAPPVPAYVPPPPPPPAPPAPPAAVKRLAPPKKAQPQDIPQQEEPARVITKATVTAAAVIPASAAVNPDTSAPVQVNAAGRKKEPKPTDYKPVVRVVPAPEVVPLVPKAVVDAKPPRKRKPVVPDVATETGSVAEPAAATQQENTVKPKKRLATIKNELLDNAAWDRERMRKGALAAELQHGQKLTRTFQDKDYVVTVDAAKKQYVLTCNGKPSAVFPTLYRATCEATGMGEYTGDNGSTRNMSAWSARKFWVVSAVKKPKS